MTSLTTNPSMAQLHHSYLLVPMMPTPNGALHLGHVAGPYLKMDVLARFLKQHGHRAALITTTDCFETHVLQSAERTGMTAHEVCKHFHEAIHRDFEYLDIAFDAFINPVSDEHAPAFRKVHAQVAEHLFALGAARVQEELFLADEATGEPVLGFRLIGCCARCGTETMGFVCEHCGLQMTTQMLREPRSVSGARAEWRQGRTLALKVANAASLARRIAGMPLPETFRQAMTEFLDEKNLIRISTLGDHGVCRHEIGGQGYTLYNTYFGHALFCGELYRERFGAERNPYAQGSGVTTVTSCGLDNATDLTASLAFAQAYGSHRSFDHCLGNFFLTLHGRKFSTGASHAIFVADLAGHGRVNVDALRMYMMSLSLHECMCDFDANDFLRLHNEWFVGELVPRINAAAAACESNAEGAPSPELQFVWQHALLQRDKAMAFDAFLPPLYVRALSEYLAYVPCSPADARCWLEGFAILAWPLIPALAGQVWRGLGRDGMPTCEALSNPSVRPPTLRLATVPRITLADLPEASATP